MSKQAGLPGLRDGSRRGSGALRGPHEPVPGHQEGLHLLCQVNKILELNARTEANLRGRDSTQSWLMYGK